MRATFFLPVLLFALPSVALAQTPDTLRGKITTDSGVVVVGADVVATRAPDRAYKSTVSDSSGNYLLVFEQGTGDYLLHVSALGRDTVRVRVRRDSSQTAITHDFQLKSSVHQLATVTVQGEADKPERDRDFPSVEPGESGRGVEGVYAAVPPDARGNLVAQAATVPGVAVTNGGISVLGLDPSQNRTTVNGMAFSGADVPRNITTYSHVGASTYDPARGWFSGAEVDVSIEGGSIFTRMPVSLTVDAPFLQYTDPTSRALGQKYSNIILGGGRSGSLRNDRLNYATAVDVSHRSSGFASLDRADVNLLRTAGVARDSADRLLGILTASGLPLLPPSASDARTTDDVTAVVRLGHSSYNYVNRSEEKMTWDLLGYAKLGRSSQMGANPTSITSHGGDDNQRILSAQASYTTFFHNRDFLTDARTSFSVKRDHTNPYLQLPEGRVLVSSQFVDAPDATTSLEFGGNSALAADTRDWTWETKNFTRFYASKKTHHRVQLTADSRIDGFSQQSPGNVLGTFSFNSLADVAANVPSSFSRTLDAPTSSVKEWNAFAAIGDYWRKSQTFQLLAGARLEANHVLDRPTYNPQVEQIFGVRNDNVPSSVHLSPRLGFTWVRKPSGEGLLFSRIGEFNLGNISYVRGGIGEFRSMLTPSTLAPAMIANGLPGGATYLTCLGTAVPTPDWSMYVDNPSTIPTTCADGSTPQFSDASRAVSLFDRSYQPPRSWRGNLSYASNLGFLVYSIEGIYSLNLNQPARRDLNFANAQQFATDVEGRPVFVGTNSIVPSTGLVSAVDARQSALFGPVMLNASDLRSISRQLTINISPDFERARSWYMSLAYTLSSVRSLASGFDAPTFGSPFEREWARGNLDARHRIQLQAGKVIKRVGLTLFGTFQSGLPYTPLVGGDVNGDGFFNDRAFVFNPLAPPDSAVGAGLRALLAGASPQTGECLTSQLGHAAGRNSCEGPWTASLNANLNTMFELPNSHGRYMTISLAIANPLGGLDQLLHGSSHLRGWGLSGFPDPVLYNVRGFDPATKRFRYEVNPRFGNTLPAASLIRAPFRVTLDVSTNIGPTTALQQLTRLVSAGRGGHSGKRLSVDDLKTRYARNVPDPYAEILEESDSLLLSEDQRAALTTAQADYLKGVDSVWTGLAEYLVALGDTYDAKEALDRQEETTDAAWEYSRQNIQRTLGKILSPIQLKLLPWVAKLLYNANKPVHIRLYSG